MNNNVSGKKDQHKTQLSSLQISFKENVFDIPTISQNSESQLMVFENTTLLGDQDHSKLGSMNRVQVTNLDKNLSTSLSGKIDNKQDYSLINHSNQSEVLLSSFNHHHLFSTPSRNELNLQPTTMPLHADVYPPNHTHHPV